MARTDDYVTEVRTAARNLWDSINTLKALQREWNALDYGSTLPDTQGLTKTEVGAVVFASADLIEDVLDTGVATNIAKVL